MTKRGKKPTLVPVPVAAPANLFAQVRAEHPDVGMPTGWRTLAKDGGLGGWSLDLDEGSMMTEAQARVAIRGWKEDHADKKKPWHYRTLLVEDVGTWPMPKAPKKRRAK